MIINMVGGANLDDGNNIEYPVPLPSQDNKAYKEASISAISSAIGVGPLTIAQMPDAIQNIKNSGLDATYVVVTISDYTVVS